MTISISTPTSNTGSIQNNSTDVLTIGSDNSVSIDTNTLHVDATNNRVGIGTSSPTQNLQIYNNGANSGQIHITNTSTGATASDGVLFGYDGSNDVIINNQEATATKFYTNAAERMRIDSAGNVGIGTSNPKDYASGITNFTVSASSIPLMTLTASGSSTDNKHYRWIARSDASGGPIMQFQTVNDAFGNEQNIWYVSRSTSGISYQSWYTGAAGSNAERMRIDSSGRVTMPYQPSFKAFQTASGQINVNNVQLVFNDVTTRGGHNIGGHYNTSTGVFTAPISGRYLMSAAMLTNAGNMGNSSVNIQWRINGTNVHYMAHNHSSFWVMETGSVIFNLSANDTVDLYLYYGSGHYGSYSYFSGRLIG